MRTNKKATKLCDMRKTHWWDHSTITNKTFDCLICNQGQGRAKRVFTLRFISQVHLPSSVMKKSRIISEICTFLWQGKSCIWKRRRWSVWAISLFLFLWRDSDWCNRAPVLKDTNDAAFSSHHLLHKYQFNLFPPLFLLCNDIFSNYCPYQCVT